MSLQEQTIRRVGSTIPIRIDVRVIAAANQPLSELMTRQAFRPDLFYRLNGIVVDVPPLRDRLEDIVPLAAHFRRTFAARLSKRVVAFAPEAVECLLRHPWPGNVRELEKAIERAVVLTASDIVTAVDLPSSVRGEADAGVAGYRGRTLAEVEKAHILAVLYEREWNQARAAEELGISRTTLWRKLREYGISPPN